MKTISMAILFLLLVSIIAIGCGVPPSAAPETTIGELSDEEVSGELDELDELEQQSQELDDVAWEEPEQAVQG